MSLANNKSIALLERLLIMTTTMWRKVRCSVCEYEQVDSVSYYLHAKAWKANHDLDKCLSIRRAK